MKNKILITITTFAAVLFVMAVLSVETAPLASAIVATPCAIWLLLFQKANMPKEKPSK